MEKKVIELQFNEAERIFIHSAIKRRNELEKKKIVENDIHFLQFGLVSMICIESVLGRVECDSSSLYTAKEVITIIRIANEFHDDLQSELVFSNENIDEKKYDYQMKYRVGRQILDKCIKALEKSGVDIALLPKAPKTPVE